MYKRIVIKYFYFYLIYIVNYYHEICITTSYMQSFSCYFPINYLDKDL